MCSFVGYLGRRALIHIIHEVENLHLFEMFLCPTGQYFHYMHISSSCMGLSHLVNRGTNGQGGFSMISYGFMARSYLQAYLHLGSLQCVMRAGRVIQLPSLYLRLTNKWPTLPSNQGQDCYG